VQREKSLDNVDHQPEETPNTERSASDLDFTARLNRGVSTPLLSQVSSTSGTGSALFFFFGCIHRHKPIAI
jgi:hypothetical protein